MRDFAIAGLQLELARGDNIERIATEIAAAKKRLPWIDMVVLGELSTFGARREDAQPMPGDAERRYQQIAREHAIWLVPGSLYERVDDQIFNTAPVIDPSGVVVARYRKIYPFLPYETGITPGDAFVTFDVPRIGCFGVSICYDMWFPETTRQLVAMGAEVIIHPTMTNTIDRDVELSIARANAAINQCYFVDINVAGDLGFGRSCIYGPGGEPLHVAGAAREIIAIDIDLDYVRRVRERGWHGLGQMLKSFRDNDVRYPVYAPGGNRTDSLSAMGALNRPAARPGDGKTGSVLPLRKGT